jgi:hypothetical protein
LHVDAESPPPFDGSAAGQHRRILKRIWNPDVLVAIANVLAIHERRRSEPETGQERQHRESAAREMKSGRVHG